MKLTFNNNDFSDPQDYTLRDIVEGMGYDLGLSDYPIFNETYRDHLNQAIYEHFMFRRIASETPAKFIFYLNRTLREQMPTYNAIYKKTHEAEFDPMDTSIRVDYGSSDSAAEGTSDSASKADGKAIASRTPQVYLEDPTDPHYMDSLTHSISEGTGNDKSANKSESSYRGASKATDGGYAAVVYGIIGSGFLATDTLVFQTLEPLFMLLTDDYPR